MAHVGPPGLLNGVEIAINDSVQILRHHLGDVLQVLQVKVSLSSKVVSRSHKLGETDTSQVANRNLIRGSVFHNLSTQVGAFDGSQVLLIGFAIAAVFVQHVGCSGLHLRIQHSKPKLLGLDGLASLALTLILLIQSLELLSPAGIQSGALIRTHQRPIPVLLYPLHKQIRNPKSVEEIAGTLHLVTMVLPQVQEGKDIGMPRLNVGSNTSLALSTSLIHVTCSVIEDTEHGHDSVGGPIGATDVTGAGTNVGDGHANSPSILADDGTVLERIVDSVNGIGLNARQEARRHLRIGRSSVKEGRRGVGEEPLGEEVIRLQDAFNIPHVDSHRDTHEHVLGTLGDLSVQLEEVGLLQCLVSEVIELEVTVVDDSTVQHVLVGIDHVVHLFAHKRSRFTRLRMGVVVEGLHDLGELLLGLLMKVRDFNAGGEDGIVGMLGREGGCGLGGEFVEFGGGYAGVHSLDDLLGDYGLVDKLWRWQGV